MHIMEGYLPASHASGWWLATSPFLAWGIRSAGKIMKGNKEAKLLLGASGGFAFVLSALKLPSVTGSSAHPTGIGLGSILFGPQVMCAIGFVVLLFQVMFLGHGGITTLGANTFSMAIVGAWVAWGVFRSLKALGLSLAVSVFFAATLADLATYITTALQLALAFPDPVSGLSGALAKFMGIFALTQVPLAISEGLLTTLVVNVFHSHGREALLNLGVISKAGESKS